MSHDKPVSCKTWAILRMESEDGPVFPIRLTWKNPKTEQDVVNYVMAARLRGDSDFMNFNHFDYVPRPEADK